MQWEAGVAAGFSEAPVEKLYAPVIDDGFCGPERVNVTAQRADPNSMLNIIRHMISVRKGHLPFGRGEFEWVDIGNESIALYQRTYQGETILAMHNVSDRRQQITMPIKKPVTGMTDLLTGKKFVASGEGLKIALEPYQYFWLK